MADGLEGLILIVSRNENSHDGVDEDENDRVHSGYSQLEHGEGLCNISTTVLVVRQSLASLHTPHQDQYLHIRPKDGD